MIILSWLIRLFCRRHVKETDAQERELRAIISEIEKENEDYKRVLREKDEEIERLKKHIPGMISSFTGKNTFTTHKSSSTERRSRK